MQVPRDRPPLQLPPRKKARLTYDADLDDDEIEAPLLLEGPSVPSQSRIDDPVDEASPEDPEFYADNENEDNDDENFPSGELGHGDDELSSDVEDADASPVEIQDLNEELLLLKCDNADIGKPVSPEGVHKPCSRSPGTNLLAKSSDTDSGVSCTISALRTAFPLTPFNTIQVELHRCKYDIEMAYNALSMYNDPILSLEDVAKNGARDAIGIANQEITESQDDHAFDVFSSPRRPLIVEVESNGVAIRNCHGGASTTTLNASHSLGEVDEPRQDDNESSETSSSGTTSSSTSDSEDESSSEEDSESEHATSEDDGSDDAIGPHSPRDLPSSESSTSEESGSYDDDINRTSNGADVGARQGFKLYASGGPDSNAAGNKLTALENIPAAGMTVGPSSESSSDISSCTSSDEDSVDSRSEPCPTTAPEQVRTKPTSVLSSIPECLVTSEPATTTMVNYSLGGKGISAPGQGLRKTQRRNARRKHAKLLRRTEAQQVDTSMESTASLDEKELQSRKEKLMKAISPDSADMKESPHADNNGELQYKDVEHLAPQAPGSEETATVDSQGDASASKNVSGRRRLLVDMGAGRRFLFAALGLKPPETKEEEVKVKEGLMKNVRPLQNARLTEKAPETGDEGGEEIDTQNPDWWKERVNYSAVECCHDGVTLSEPPFPFVQRWDPRQQHDIGGKRKREQSEYIGNEATMRGMPEGGNADTEKLSRTNKKRKGGTLPVEGFGEGSANSEEGVRLANEKSPQKSNQDMHLNDQAPDADDLPSLPPDISVLPLLQSEEVKPGMVITWKQLKLPSRATGWQPQLAFMTGLVLPDSDAATLRIVLAKRDRSQDERTYDEQTGERVYGKFEAPDMEGEEEELDDGHREMPWSEMTEPRLVQEEPSASPVGSPANVQDSETSNQSIGFEMIEVRDGAAQDDQERTSEDEGQAQPESNISLSIHSGQGLPLSYAAEGLVSMSNDSWEASKSNSAVDCLNSPSLQLMETSQQALLDKTGPELIMGLMRK